MAEKRGQGHASAVSVDGWTVLLWIEAAPKLPVAVNVGPMQAPEARWTRALVTQARLPRQAAARRHQVSFDRGVWEGPTRWWLAQQAVTGGVPANAQMAVTADARAPAAAGAALTGGRRVHTRRHGPGRQAWTARRETDGVGLPGLTTDEP
jgi:hypothetical protein